MQRGGECSLFLVLGAWFLVPGSWFLVLGSWFLVLFFMVHCVNFFQLDP